uniref:Uncharacterized protein n=1 Tax=Rhizophora mucronata TaxID=61149 RepID=A0A2P2N9X1_RHIMU
MGVWWSSKMTDMHLINSISYLMLCRHYNWNSARGSCEVDCFQQYYLEELASCQLLVTTS